MCTQFARVCIINNCMIFMLIMFHSSILYRINIECIIYKYVHYLTITFIWFISKVSIWVILEAIFHWDMDKEIIIYVIVFINLE